MSGLDEIDRKLLNLLQQDSRLTLQQLADKVGLSPTPCHRRNFGRGHSLAPASRLWRGST